MGHSGPIQKSNNRVFLLKISTFSESEDHSRVKKKSKGIDSNFITVNLIVLVLSIIIVIVILPHQWKSDIGILDVSKVTHVFFNFSALKSVDLIIFREVDKV